MKKRINQTGEDVKKGFESLAGGAERGQIDKLKDYHNRIKAIQEEQGKEGDTLEGLLQDFKQFAGYEWSDDLTEEEMLVKQEELKKQSEGKFIRMKNDKILELDQQLLEAKQKRGSNFKDLKKKFKQLTGKIWNEELNINELLTSPESKEEEQNSEQVAEKVKEKIAGEAAEAIDEAESPPKDVAEEVGDNIEQIKDAASDAEVDINAEITKPETIEADAETGILSPELIVIMDKIRKYKKYQEEFEKNKQIIEGESVEQLQERFNTGKKAEELFMELQQYKLTTLKDAKNKIDNKEWAKARNDYSSTVAQIDAEQEWLKENFINQNKSDQIVINKESSSVEVEKPEKEQVPATKENIESGASFTSAVAVYYSEFEDIKENFKQKSVEKGYNKAQNDFIPGSDFKVESREVYMKRLEAAKSESEPDYYRIGINIKFLQALDNGEIKFEKPTDKDLPEISSPETDKEKSEPAEKKEVEQTTDKEKAEGMEKVKQDIEAYANGLTLEDFKDIQKIKAGIEKIVNGFDPKLLGADKPEELKNIVASYYGGIIAKVEEVLQVSVAKLEAEEEKKKGNAKKFFKGLWKEAKQSVIKPGVGGAIYGGAMATGRAAMTLLDVSGVGTVATVGIGAFAGAGAAAVDHVFGTNLLNKMGDWGKGRNIKKLISKLEKNQKPEDLQKALQQEFKEDLQAMAEYDIARQGDLEEMTDAIKMTESGEAQFKGNEQEQQQKQKSMSELIELTERAKFEKSDKKLDKLAKKRQKLLKENIKSGAVGELLNTMVQKKVEKVLEEQGKDWKELPPEEQNQILAEVSLMAEQQMNSLFGDVVVQEKFDEISESAKGYFGKSYIGKLLNEIPIEGFLKKVIHGAEMGAVASLAFDLSPVSAAAYFGVKRFMGSLRGEIIQNQPDKVRPQIVKGITETKEVLDEINANLVKDPKNKELQQKQAEVQGILAELDKKLEEVNKAVDEMGDLVKTVGEVMENLDALLEISDEKLLEQVARDVIVNARARLKLPAMKAPDRAKIEQKIKLIQDRIIQLKLTSESSEYNEKTTEDIVKNMQSEQSQEVGRAADLAKQEKKRMQWLGKKGLIVQYAKMWRQTPGKAVAVLGKSLGRASIAAASGTLGAGGLDLGMQIGGEYANTGEVNTANLQEGFNNVLDNAVNRATLGGSAIAEKLGELPDDDGGQSEAKLGELSGYNDPDKGLNNDPVKLAQAVQEKFPDLNLEVDNKGVITREGYPGIYSLQQDGDLHFKGDDGNEQILKAGGGDNDWQPAISGGTLDEYLENKYQDIAKSDQLTREQIDKLAGDPHGEQLLNDLAADGKIVLFNNEYFSLQGLGITAENLADGVDNVELQKVLESVNAGNPEAAKLLSHLEANKQIEKFTYPSAEEDTTIDKYYATGTHFEDTIDSSEVRGDDSLWRSTRDVLSNNAAKLGFEGDLNNATEVRQWAEGKTAELVNDLAAREGEITDLVHQGDRITIDITPEGAQLNLVTTSGQEAGHLDDTNVVGSEAARHLAQFYGVTPETVEGSSGDVGMKFELNGEGNEGKSVTVMDWDRDGNPNVQLPDGTMQEMTMDEFKEYLADNMEIAEERIIIPADSVAEISENLDITGIDTSTISEADFAAAQESLSDIYDDLFTDDHELSEDALNNLSNAEKIVLAQDIDRVHQLVNSDKESFKNGVYGENADDMRHQEVRDQAQEYAKSDIDNGLENNAWTLWIANNASQEDMQGFIQERFASGGISQNNEMNIFAGEWLQYDVNPDNPQPLTEAEFKEMFFEDGEFSQEKFNEKIQEFKDQIKINKLPESGAGWKPMLIESGIPMLVRHAGGEGDNAKYDYKMPGGPEQERTILGMNAMLHSVSEEQQTEWQEKTQGMREDRTELRVAREAEAQRVATEAQTVPGADPDHNIPGGGGTGEPKPEADKGKGIENPITAPAVEPIPTQDIEKPIGMKEMLDADFSDGAWSPNLALGQEINETIPSEWREPGNPYSDLGKELGIDLSKDLSSEDITKLQQTAEEIPTQNAVQAAEILEALENRARDYHADKLGIDLSDGLSQAEFDKLYKAYFAKDANAMELANFLRNDPEMSKTLNDFIKGKEAAEVPGANPDDIAAATAGGPEAGKEQTGKTMTINGQEVNVKAGVYADADLNKYQKAVEQVEGYIDVQNKVLQEYLNTSKELSSQEKVYFKEYLSTVGETYDKLLTKMGSDLEVGKKIDFNITPPSEQQGIELAQQIIKSMNEFGIPSVDFYTNYDPDNQTAQIIPTAEVAGALDKFGLTLKDGELEIKGSNDKYTFIKENSTNGNIATKLNFYNQGADTILVKAVDNDGKVDSLKIEIKNGQPKVVEENGKKV